MEKDTPKRKRNFQVIENHRKPIPPHICEPPPEANPVNPPKACQISPSKQFPGDAAVQD